mmetsp:Transcript_5726/g.7164  ORF Transcript_5726/g.7164 Transcript_5726/m.7164 type:complete len:95 (+) Transcript_5726:184-468(+)|eukprot:CAMPEP_0172488776 /NCGR_PEP_ID=MMETSP1066-20121228/18511_1 /TAXON_ID=671091 /ORGANISM="Coscinodiscus wailesii, Strain CCMP2513" /LENGTH=94 /DNA_ID=CAMNT_0013256233 /DNA_START=171 /DNA_END=455 /DNA_ORIENTATION=-
MGRVDGRKVVAVATTGMLAFVGVATVYLPYFCDRDQIRGLGEDENKTEEEYREMLMQLRRERQKRDEEAAAAERKVGAGGSAGSMWKNMSERKG